MKKQRNYRKRLNYTIAVCLLVLFYAWLGRYAYAPEGGAPGRDRARVGMAAGNRVTTRSHGLVAQLRKDIPIYVPSGVRTCHVVDPDVKATAVLHTAAPIEAVSGFYRTAMPRNGWNATAKPAPAPAGKQHPEVVFRGEKAGCELTIRLTDGGSGTDIGVRLMPKPKPVAAPAPSS